MGTKEFEKVLEVYADDEAFNELLKNPVAAERLRALAPEILDAVARNGYDANTVITSAKGQMLSKIYGKLYDAVNKKDEAEAERQARRALRVGGAIQGAFRSVKNKTENYKQTLTPEMSEAIYEAFRKRKDVMP